MQQLDNSLNKIGYIYSRKLLDFNNQSYLPNSEIKCHYYDILVQDSNSKDPNTEKNSKLYDQFLKVISSSSSLNDHITQPISQKREFIQNNERREYLIKEFIQTEANYLASLKAFVSAVVEPLRQKSKDRLRAVIGQYECANIFMNIDEIIQVTEAFYEDLMKYDPKQQNFGDLCLTHMSHFSCYNRFLLGIPNARILNEKQLRNPAYAHFVEKAKISQNTGNQTVYDYLALPSQRVGRYTMYFKELLKHTTDDHPDLNGLHASLIKMEEIANIREDKHTQLMKIFHQLLQAIQFCPESLISFQRQLIGYLDVVEVDLQTLKPVQPITLFLFSDKIMVVKRPSYEVDGLDLCGLIQRRHDFYIRKDAAAGKMKFIGWISLTDVDIYDGPKDNSLKSFSLMCNNSGTLFASPNLDQATQLSLEGYFQHKHSFSIVGAGNVINKDCFQTIEKMHSYFIYQFGKTKNDLNQSNELIRMTYHQWNGHHFFANIYSATDYPKVENKCKIVIFYIEKNTFQIEAILKSCQARMIGFIVPHEKDNNYRFAIRSKVNIGNTEDDKISLLTFQSDDQLQIQKAQNLLFGNLFFCDEDLYKSFTTHTQPQEQHNNSRFSMVKQELKKSKSTFKLFSSLTNIPQQQQQLSQSKKQQKHKSMTDIREPRSPVETRPRVVSAYSEYILNAPPSEHSSIYHHSTSSASSIHSTKSYHSQDSKMTLKSLASNNNQSTISKDGSYQSSLYRIASESTNSIANQPRYFSPSFHPSRTASYEIQSLSRKKQVEDTDGAPSFRSQSITSSRETTPSMVEHGSESSTIRSNSSSPYHFDIIPTRSKSDILIPIVGQPPTEKSLYDSEIFSLLEEKNRTIQALTSLLKKKDEEIDMLKADLEDSVFELGIVCDKFNSELEGIASMYEQHQPDRPPNPSPDTQIQRKLEMTLKERNQWQLKAKELELQLQLLLRDQPNNDRSFHRRSYS